MSVFIYPRVETIVVPGDVKLEFAGAYATQRAHEILRDIGVGGVVPRTARLSVHPSDPYLFSLTFDVTGTYTIPKEVDIRCADKTECSKVECNSLAAGNQEGPSKPIKVRGSK